MINMNASGQPVGIITADAQYNLSVLFMEIGIHMMVMSSCSTGLHG